jgi:hypothetical protein
MVILRSVSDSDTQKYGISSTRVNRTQIVTFVCCDRREQADIHHIADESRLKVEVEFQGQAVIKVQIEGEWVENNICQQGK